MKAKPQLRNEDEKIWEEIKSSYKKAQEKIFKERYPDLYAKIRNKKWFINTFLKKKK